MGGSSPASAALAAGNSSGNGHFGRERSGSVLSGATSFSAGGRSGRPSLGFGSSGGFGSGGGGGGAGGGRGGEPLSPGGASGREDGEPTDSYVYVSLYIYALLYVTVFYCCSLLFGQLLCVRWLCRFVVKYSVRSWDIEIIW